MLQRLLTHTRHIWHSGPVGGTATPHGYAAGSHGRVPLAPTHAAHAVPREPSIKAAVIVPSGPLQLPCWL